MGRGGRVAGPLIAPIATATTASPQLVEAYKLSAQELIKERTGASAVKLDGEGRYLGVHEAERTWALADWTLEGVLLRFGERFRSDQYGWDYGAIQHRALFDLGDDPLTEEPRELGMPCRYVVSPNGPARDPEAKWEETADRIRRTRRAEWEALAGVYRLARRIRGAATPRYLFLRRRVTIGWETKLSLIDDPDTARRAVTSETPRDQEFVELFDLGNAGRAISKLRLAAVDGEHEICSVEV